MKNPGKRSFSKQPNNFRLYALFAILFFVIIIGVVAFLKNSTAAAAGFPTEVTVSQGAEMQSQGAFILDVRQPEEWTQFHIPGATLIPLGDLPNRLSEVPKDRNVVVVCRTGHRSAQGRDILRNAGFKNVTSMAGGVTQWQAEGLPIASGK